jgi:hypothetical protein
MDTLANNLDMDELEELLKYADEDPNWFRLENAVNGEEIGKMWMEDAPEEQPTHQLPDLPGFEGIQDIEPVQPETVSKRTPQQEAATRREHRKRIDALKTRIYAYCLGAVQSYRPTAVKLLSACKAELESVLALHQHIIHNNISQEFPDLDACNVNISMALNIIFSCKCTALCCCFFCMYMHFIIMLQALMTAHS